MNFLLIPTLLIAAVLFALGVKVGQRFNKTAFWPLCVAGFLAAIPGILFAAYYLKILGEPIWLYRFRSVPFTELAASGAGFIAGLLHGKCSPLPRFRRIAGAWFFPGILVIGLVVPYVKQFRRPLWDQFQDRWSEDVCLQTSDSSCGPACAATLLRKFGQSATEQEIARASFTSRNGTENWYLARTLRVRGLDVKFAFEPGTNKPWPCPSIAGVRLPESANSGHFIVLLERVGDKYVVADPITGKSLRTQSDLRGTYDFTGFFMAVGSRQ